jgi:TolB-like protein
VNSEQLVASGNDKRETSKKRKLRGVWISFAGRIIAQILGAAATIVLGMLVLHKYQGSGESRLSAVEATAAKSAAVRPMRNITESATPSIAVLPLANFSADPHDQYFADAMTEAVVGELAQVEGLRVISRTSTARYKSETKSIPEIGDELGVDFVVEGSIVKDGRRVRITAQLIDADTDEHLWALSYDRPADDELAVQQEIAEAITRDLTSRGLHR